MRRWGKWCSEARRWRSPSGAHVWGETGQCLACGATRCSASASTLGTRCAMAAEETEVCVVHANIETWRRHRKKEKVAR